MLLLHRLPASVADFTQQDIDYCCLPQTNLLDLAQEAVALNPTLTIPATPLDLTPSWALAFLHQEEQRLLSSIQRQQATLQATFSSLDAVRAQIRSIRRANNNN